MSEIIAEISGMSVPEIIDARSANVAMARLTTIEAAINSLDELDRTFEQFIDYSIETFKKVADFYRHSVEKPMKHKATINYFLRAKDEDVSLVREVCLSEHRNVNGAVTAINKDRNDTGRVEKAKREYATCMEEYEDTGVTNFRYSFTCPNSCLKRIEIQSYRDALVLTLQKQGAVLTYPYVLANPSTDAGKAAISEYIADMASRVEHETNRIRELSLYVDRPFELLRKNAPHIRWTEMKSE